MKNILCSREYKEANKYINSLLNMLIDFQNEEYTYENNYSGSRSKNVVKIFDDIYLIAKQMGLSELIELTTVDKTSIPVFLAKKDNLFHHNYGKGVENEQAKVSALMEFIERISSEKHNKTEIEGKYIDIVKKFNCEVVKPSSLITYYTEYVADSLNINWIPIYNLNKNGISLIPTIAVLFPYEGDKYEIFSNNTNGLASGSTFHEAIIQGIYEVIERDVISLGLATCDFDDVEISTISDKKIQNILNELKNNGIDVYIKYVKNQFNMPCFIVSGDDTVNKTPTLLCGGYGCHTNKNIALMRALTELVQSRKSLIYGGRKDLKPFKMDALEKDEYEQRKMKNIKLYSNYGNKISFDMIDTFSFGNLNEELEYVIQLLEENMMNIYVENLTDYSIKDAPPVVRVVIPTLENWYDTRDRLGSRLYERMENVDYE